MVNPASESSNPHVGASANVRTPIRQVPRMPSVTLDDDILNIDKLAKDLGVNIPKTSPLTTPNKPINKVVNNMENVAKNSETENVNPTRTPREGKVLVEGPYRGKSLDEAISTEKEKQVKSPNNSLYIMKRDLAKTIADLKDKELTTRAQRELTITTKESVYDSQTQAVNDQIQYHMDEITKLRERATEIANERTSKISYYEEKFDEELSTINLMLQASEMSLKHMDNQSK